MASSLRMSLDSWSNTMLLLVIMLFCNFRLSTGSRTPPGAVASSRWRLSMNMCTVHNFRVRIAMGAMTDGQVPRNAHNITRGLPGLTTSMDSGIILGISLVSLLSSSTEVSSTTLT